MMEQAGLLVTGTGKPVALRGVHIETVVNDVTARTTLAQRFRNAEAWPIEATYCFPVEESAAIYRLRVTVGDREIEAVSEEKEKALTTYDAAIERGDGAFLMQREAADVFVLAVGNLKPGEEAVIRVEYATVLPMTGGCVRLQIPTTVSPRYVPPGSDPVRADAVSPPYALDVPYGLTLSVRIGGEVGSVSSPSHPVTVERHADECRVSLAQESAALDRDFLLEIRPRAEEAAARPLCLIGQHENGDRAALVRFYPTFAPEDYDESAKCDLLFVLDCSGSMEGTSIRAAKTALELCLRSLNVGDVFNIVCFGSTYRAYAPKPVEYDAAAFEKALKYVRGIEADLGGTELFQTLKYACSSLPVAPGYRRDVILLTDGEVFDTDEITRYVAQSHGGARFYTFGIGYGASHALIKGLARVTHGASEMIQPGEAIEEKVLRQFSRLTQPRLEQVQIAVTDGEFAFSPDLPPVYAGDSFTALGEVRAYRPESVVTLSGTVAGGARRREWTCALRDLGRDDTVPLLRAADRIRYLEERGSAADASPEPLGPSAPPVRRSRSAIRDLALRYNLASAETSFVAIEKRTSDEKSFDPQYRRIPVLLTKDYGAVDIPAFHRSTPPRGPFSMSLSDSGPPSAGAPAPRARRPGGGTHSGMLKELSDRLAGRDGSAAEPEPGAEADAEGVYDLDAGDTDAGASWYIRLLKTQDADGTFRASDVLAERLNLAPRQRLTDAIEAAVAETAAKTGADPDLIRRAVRTLLAVRLLRADAAAASLSARAIRKAEAWLRAAVFPLLPEADLDRIAANVRGG